MRAVRSAGTQGLMRGQLTEPPGGTHHPIHTDFQATNGAPGVTAPLALFSNLALLSHTVARTGLPEGRVRART